MPVPSAHLRPRARPAVITVSSALGLLLTTSCYGGDFFERLADPTATAAFRITQLTLVDPHAFTGNEFECSDFTANLNQFFAKDIGSYDVNNTLVLHPLDPAIDTGAKMEILPAFCVPGGELVNCTDKDVPPASIVSANFNNSVGGSCGNPVAGSLNPQYMTGSNEPLHQATSPCFVSAPIPALSLQLTKTATLPLSNVQIYASYSLNGKPQELVSGVLFGFVPESVAMTSIGSVGGSDLVPYAILRDGGGCHPIGMEKIDDIDTLDPESGVWMYFNFTARRAAWSSGSGMTDTGDTAEVTSSTGSTTDLTGTTSTTTTTTTASTGGTDGTTGSTSS